MDGVSVGNAITAVALHCETMLEACRLALDSRDGNDTAHGQNGPAVDESTAADGILLLDEAA
jgi:hypothetical protein